MKAKKPIITRPRIVITGVGLTCPGANSLAEFRHNLLENKSRLSTREIEGLGQVAAGICHFDEEKHLAKKMRKRGTRSGSIATYCAREALEYARLEAGHYSPHKTGVYLGTTEHGSIETELEFARYLAKERRISRWSHHHNPRMVSNAPAGEVTLNLKITGPHYMLGGACAAGNIALIQGVQMLQLGEVDLALSGGVSGAIEGLALFASFYAQGALALGSAPQRACRPLDRARNGIVISEGGAIFCLERLEDALERGAPILGEICSFHINSDATDFVNPNCQVQAECVEHALEKAGLTPSDIGLVNLHATGTEAGDQSEAEALRRVFEGAPNTHFNCTKGFIGHAMGAAGALELAGNLPSFWDGLVHGSKNTEQLDPSIKLDNVVMDNQTVRKEVGHMMNISFGMLGINSCVVVKKYT